MKKVGRIPQNQNKQYNYLFFYRHIGTTSRSNKKLWLSNKVLFSIKISQICSPKTKTIYIGEIPTTNREF